MAQNELIMGTLNVSVWSFVFIWAVAKACELYDKWSEK